MSCPGFPRKTSSRMRGCEMHKVDYRLNAIVDGSLRDIGDLAVLARIAADNGATIIQYRDKQASTRELLEQATAIRAALARSGVPLVVNDRVDVALAAGADGVHLGRDDFDPATALRLLRSEERRVGKECRPR